MKNEATETGDNFPRDGSIKWWNYSKNRQMDCPLILKNANLHTAQKEWGEKLQKGLIFLSNYLMKDWYSEYIKNSEM